MAARAVTSERVVLHIQIHEGLQAMGDILGAGIGLHNGIVRVGRIKWKSFLSQMPFLPPFLENFKQHRASAKTAIFAGGAAPCKDLVKSGIRGILKDVLGDDSLSDFSAPPMNMVLDSLAAVEFRNRVQSAFDGVCLSSAVMFDYPNVADLTEFILSQFSDGDDDEAGGVMRDVGAAIRDPMALVGIAGRYPGMGIRRLVFWHSRDGSTQHGRTPEVAARGGLRQFP